MSASFSPNRADQTLPPTKGPPNQLPALTNQHRDHLLAINIWAVLAELLNVPSSLFGTCSCSI